MSMPLVTIGIPVFNGGAFLEGTLQSIINQTYTNIEIIISDNASTDNSLEIIEAFQAKDPRITYLREDRNIGYSRNVNKILRQAKGEYISIFHSDDQYHPDMVKTEVQFLTNNLDCGGVFTLVDCINENDELIPKDLLIDKLKITSDLILQLSDYLDWMTLVGNILICPSGMIRSSVYAKVGLYSEAIVLVEDQDMWLRILEVTNLGVIAKPLMKYRIHTRQASQVYRTLDRTYVDIPRQHLCTYLDQKPQYKALRDRLSFLIADDLIQIAKRNFLKLKFSRCRDCLTKAKSSLNGTFFEYSNYRDVIVLGMFVTSLYRALFKRLNISLLRRRRFH